MFIKHFGLQAASKYARECWEFVNLYSRTRGINRFPALSNAESFFQSVVQGHAHSAAGVQYGANRNMRYFGLQVGCGVDYRKAAMAYGVKYPRKPILGCGIVIDGKTALFEPMDLKNRYNILK